MNLEQKTGNVLFRNSVSLGGAFLATFFLLVLVSHLSLKVSPREEKDVSPRDPIPMVTKRQPEEKRFFPKDLKSTEQTQAAAVDLPALSLPSTIPAPRPIEPDLRPGELVRSTLQKEESLLVEEDLVLSEEMVDHPPKPIVRKQPRYPLAAQERSIEGEVVLNVLVGKDGEVKRIEVAKGDPPGVFEDSARQAVSGWRFRPATFRSRPVQVWVSQTISFNLR